MATMGKRVVDARKIATDDVVIHDGKRRTVRKWVRFTNDGDTTLEFTDNTILECPAGSTVQVESHAKPHRRGCPCPRCVREHLANGCRSLHCRTCM